MVKFILKELINTDIESELENIGFDIAYRAKASEKFNYKTLKIFDLTLPQANILKQTALSLGADCGVHRDVLTNNIEKTNAILGGSISQLKKICEKLIHQPFSMKILAETILAQLEIQKKQTKLVGILNITPDSFSDGGKYFSIENAVKHYHQLIKDGADIIDIGAESTKPNAKSVSAEEQIKRLAPFFKEINEFEIPISIDTKSSDVAKFALDNGAKIINDVSGLDYDSKIADIVAEYNATLVIQHSCGASGNSYKYNDVVEDVYLSLLKKSEFAQSKGVKNLIIDVGIGFSKTKEENIELINRIEEFHSLNLPLMLGISRKSFLGVNNNDNYIKDTMTLAMSYSLINKVDFLRVHNIELHKQLLNSAI